MIDYAGVYEELTAVIGSVWPETKANGIFETDRIERVSFERLPGPPYAVIETPAPEPSERLLTVESYEIRVRVHYICHENQGHKGVREIRRKLTALSAYFYTNDMTYADVIDTGRASFGDDHPSNETFITKGMPLNAGSVDIHLVVSDTGG